MSSFEPDDALRDRLLRENEEYRMLATEHQEHEQRIGDLTRKPFLSEEEKVLEKTLKKRKLALKDQMYALMQRHRRKTAGDRR